MRWDDLLERPLHRDVHGALIVLEELDDDTGTATYRRAGACYRVLRPGQLVVRPLDGELVDDEPLPPRRSRFVAAGVAAAGLAWLATRRRG